jgi:hypothetical protein
MIGIAHLLVAAALASSTLAAGPADVLERFDLLDRDVREGRIDPVQARARMTALHADLRARYPLRKGAAGTPVFPVGGYGLRDVGGRHGSGFVPNGYRYYDGPRHGGHPAHDIFIRDTDRDTLDDATSRPVPVYAFVGGTVVGIERDWRPEPATRGGNHVWLLADSSDVYYCYAHLASVEVAPGKRVAAGERLGTVGRSGKNAYPRRSPTHLHFMALAFDGGAMTPVDTFRDLQRALKSPPSAE